ncbi:nuclear transport factor 2 family protein [Steroidobacter flavus]|uniref:Nuclear transport factor 2 family protein n=1 Tax=Steroidobacter flavus TaxID=1842136 RepID=A0ABV8T3Q8_9GAMM
MADTAALEAHLAISKVKARYCRMLDTKDWAGFGALFTEDFVLDVSEGTSVPVIRGREAALQQVQTLVGNARTVHQVHTPEIDVQGDEALVIWAMQDRVVWDEPRRGLASITGYGHYHERYVRQNGEWKIASLKLTRLHLDTQLAK